VIAFDAIVKAALLALDDGDSLALVGTLTPKVRTDRNGAAKIALDMVAHGVLSAYHVQRKRKALRAGYGTDKPVGNDILNGGGSP
jgi:hypothetical protein